MKSLFAGCLMLLASGAVAKVANAPIDKRASELRQIGKYELVDLDYDSDSNVLSFVGFGHSYALDLNVNENIVFSKVKHMVDGEVLANAQDGYISGLTESCHYRIDREKGFSGAISMCNKRGVRGSIKGFNETLIIKPANYYLDSEFDKDKDSFYDISDKHLIYLMSDYNTTGIEKAFQLESRTVGKGSKHGTQLKNTKLPPGEPSLISKTASASSYDFKGAALNGASMAQPNGGRRLLADENECEMLIFVDPWYYDMYVDDYGSSDYYDTLVADIGDYVNGMSDLFGGTDWGNDVGSIEIYFVAILVMTAFSGDYASMEPSWSNSEVDSGDYLNNMKSWLDNTGIGDDYDATQIFVGTDSFDTGGLAWVGTICYGSYASGLTGMRNGDYVYPYDTVVHIATHELGHTFGCSHDQDTSCGNDGGLMGYGSNWDEFSSCSIDFVQELWEDQSTTCLRDGVRGFDDDSDEGGGGSSPTPKPTDGSSPTPKPTDGDTGGGDGDFTCYNFEEIYGYDLNNDYEYGGEYNGKAYYQSVEEISGYTWYFYYSDDWNGYMVYPYFYDTWAWHFCESTDLSSCGQGDWTYYDYDSSSWQDQDDAYVSFGGDTDTDTTDGGDYDCTYYDCVGLWSFDDTYYDYDGSWTFANECYDGQAVYSKDIDGQTWYIYYGSWGGWHGYPGLGTSSAYIFCYSDDIMDCGGSWYNYVGSWLYDTDSYVYECSGTPSYDGKYSDTDTITTDGITYVFDDDCTNDYGDSVCIYNDGSLWGGDSAGSNDGIATFEYNGCVNGYPFFHYKYTPITGNYSTTYYLHFESTYSDSWLISESSVEDTSGMARCNETDLTMCTYEQWTIQTNDGDAVTYEVENSMGYDGSCVSVDTDDSSAYCDTDGACAMWMYKLGIEDKTYSVDLCEDTYAQCIMEPLLTDAVGETHSNLLCHSDYDISLYMNVSFVSTSGSATYLSYINDYQSVVDECIVSPDATQQDFLSVSVLYSKLNKCDACSEFDTTSGTTNDDENQESGAVSAFSVTASAMFAVLGAALLH